MSVFDVARSARQVPAQPALRRAPPAAHGRHNPAVRLEDLLRTVLPAYEAEGRSYLTIDIGCTGGRHRSVAIAEESASRLRPAAPPSAPPTAT
jgi:hypothetical protein